MIRSQQQRQLLTLARESITWGLQHGKPLPVETRLFDEELHRQGACFVTLHLHQQLRGCIGSLEAHQSLLNDVSENAYSAAFRDPRFDPLQADELADTEISISVLTPSIDMKFESESDLIAQLRPGVDGLVLKSGFHKGTFLPSVWDQLPEPRQFLRHLKRKAGLDLDYWSDNIQVSRYQTHSFAEEPSAAASI